MSSSTITVKELLPSESKTASCPTPPSTAISAHSLVKDTQSFIEALRMSSQVDSPASRSVSPESARAQTTSATCGPQPLTPYAQLDPATASLRTFQACLLPGILNESSVTLPKAGIACDGAVYRLPK